MHVLANVSQSRERVKQLRKLGYRVKIVMLPNGDRLVLSSKKRFVCRAHHCTWKRDPGGAPAVPLSPKVIGAKPKKRKSSARETALRAAISKTKRTLAANRKRQAALRKAA